VLGQGKVDINQDGEIRVDGSLVDRLKIVAFEDPAALLSEGGTRFAPAQPDALPLPAADTVVRQGYQEQSNVNPMLATVRMLEIMRHFEAIQKSISLMYNDMDAKAIERLSR
jgi:flagellar basal-body rod protein FlgF